MSAPDTTELPPAAGTEAAPAGGADAASPAVAAPKPRPKRDRKPSKRPKRKPGAGRPPGAPNKTTIAARTKELEAELARVLVFPAIPAVLLAPDQETALFMQQHFTQAGPSTAHQLALASESSPQLREILERMTQGSVTMMIALAAIGYVAPVALWTIGRRQHALGVSMALSADPEQIAAAAEAFAAAAPPAPPPEPEPQPAAGDADAPAPS